MKPKNPDRWERIVDKVLERDGRFSHYGVADLLRKEHAWVRRMVRKVYAWQCEQLADDEDVIGVILNQLKRRAK